MRSLLCASSGVARDAAGVLLAFFIGFVAMVGPATERLIRHFQARQIEDAIGRFERGGPAEAARPTRSTQPFALGHALPDRRHRPGYRLGRGSIGAPPRARSRFGPPQLGRPGLVVEPSEDGRHRLIILATPPFDVWAYAPYYALILVAISVLCWLARHGIVTPLRELANAVTDSAAAIYDPRHAVRRDEIGLLARAFNHMAPASRRC